MHVSQVVVAIVDTDVIVAVAVTDVNVVVAANVADNDIGAIVDVVVDAAVVNVVVSVAVDEATGQKLGKIFVRIKSLKEKLHSYIWTYFKYCIFAMVIRSSQKSVRSVVNSCLKKYQKWELKC